MKTNTKLSLKLIIKFRQIAMWFRNRELLKVKHYIRNPKVRIIIIEVNISILGSSSLNYQMSPLPIE